MKRFTLITVATLLALATVAMTALALELESADLGPAAPNQGTARLRVAHLAPFAPDPGSALLPGGTAVTVTLDGTPLLTDIRFGDSITYTVLPTGTYEVGIWPAGSTTPVLTESVTLAEDTDYSAIAIGGANGWPLELLLLVDDNTAASTPGWGKVRVGHLAPFAPTLPGTLADVWVNGAVLFPNVPYKLVTGYNPLPPTRYQLDLTPAGQTLGLRVFGPGYLTLEASDIASVFAVGDGDYHSVAIFVWPSGEPGFLLYDNFMFLPLVMKNVGTLIIP